MMSLFLPSYCVVPELETMATEAASLGPEVNWQKTKVQALSSREDEPSTITAQGQKVVVVKIFVYLGSLIHSTTQSSPDISRRNVITRAAMQNQECRTGTVKYGSHESPYSPSWSCIILAFYPFSCTVLSAGQLPRRM